MKYEEQLKKRNGLLHFYGAVYAGSVMFWGLFHFFIIKYELVLAIKKTIA